MIFKSQLLRASVPEFSVAEDKKYVDAFPEPRDDFDRVAFQYQCGFRGANKIRLALLNALGIIAGPVFILLYLFNGLRFKKAEHHNAVLVNEKFLAGMTYEGRVPEELYTEFGDILVMDFMKYPELFGGILNGAAVRMWWKLVARHPLHGHMNTLCLVHLASVQKMIAQYTPKAIVTYMAELNFASCLITHYCESLGIEYICFMHGDYLTNKRRAFVRFSRMYLWDPHYRDVFRWSRCPEGQYRYYFPQMYQLKFENKTPEFYLTYYFSGNDNSAQSILQMMCKLQQEGKKCKIRPHPRYTDIAYITPLFENAGIMVEKPLELPLEESLADTECAAARCSTVLTQAYYAGKMVFLDDISDPDFYHEMKESMYIMESKPHQLLSEL